MSRHFPHSVRVLAIDIDAPLQPLDLKGCRTWCLVRLHGRIMGVMELGCTGAALAPETYAAAIWDNLSTRINEHLAADGLVPAQSLDSIGLPIGTVPLCMKRREQCLAHAPMISVVIPTHNRPDRLQRCLTGVMSAVYRPFEVIVVDNAPAQPADVMVEAFARALPIRYVREDRRGVSWARNRGLKEAQGELIAFIDDDVVPDPNWLTELAMGFGAGANVACVTGLILPAELNSNSQLWFEQFGRLAKGFDGRLFDLDGHRPDDPLYPYTAGTFGSGANFGFRTAILRRLGGFDNALGTGTLARGGEDLDACFRVVQAGYQVRYEPASMVFHAHPAEYDLMRNESYSYGVGLAAFISKSMLAKPGRCIEVGRRLPRAVNYLLNPHSAKNRAKGPDYPGALSALELLGILYGPVAYVRSLASLRHLSQLS